MPFVAQLGVNAGFGYAMATDRKQFLTGFAISQGVGMVGGAIIRANDARTARMNSAATPPSAGVSASGEDGEVVPDKEYKPSVPNSDSPTTITVEGYQPGGTNSYEANTTRNDLQTIYATPEGHKAIADIISTKGNSVSIVQTEGGNGTIPYTVRREDGSTGVGVVIEYNPYNTLRAGGVRGPAYIGLAHELSHAKSMVQGTYDRDVQAPAPQPTPSINPSKLPSLEEFNARVFENIFRNGKIPLRDLYNNKPVEVKKVR